MQQTPFSLYIALSDEKKADLEVIARAALSLSAAIKDAAYVIDPSMEIRIELVSGTESSLSLNSLIKALNDGDLITKKRLKVLSLLFLTWFSTHLADKGFDAAWDAVFNNSEISKLSDEERKEIADAVVEALTKRVAASKVREVYAALEEDPAIAGVGATTKSGKRPDDIVPRSQFPERAISDPIDTPSGKKRFRDRPMRAVLVSPVLKAGERRWKFSGPEGEFGAVIKDAHFIENLLSGRQIIPMMTGIELDIALRTHEEFDGGLWKPTNHEVMRIIKVHRPMTQGHLHLPSAEKPPSTKRSKQSKQKRKR